MLPDERWFVEMIDARKLFRMPVILLRRKRYPTDDWHIGCTIWQEWPPSRLGHFTMFRVENGIDDDPNGFTHTVSPESEQQRMLLLPQPQLHDFRLQTPSTSFCCLHNSQHVNSIVTLLSSLLGHQRSDRFLTNTGAVNNGSPRTMGCRDNRANGLPHHARTRSSAG